MAAREGSIFVGWPRNAHAKETGLLGAEAVANSMVLYAALQFATGRVRPLKGQNSVRFWRTMPSVVCSLPGIPSPPGLRQA